MKKLVLTDLHLHTYEKFGRKDSTSLPKRLAEQEAVLNQVWDIIQRENIDVLIFGGDWFHHDLSIPTECLNVTRRFFERISLSSRWIRVVACRGNHDLLNKSRYTDYTYSLQPFLGLNLPIEGVNDKKQLYLLHYDEEVDYKKIVGYDVVVAHKTPIGCKVHNYVFDEGVDWETLSKNNGLVLFGHIHMPQQLSKNCYVVGSPMHLNFGEMGDHGVIIIDDDNKMRRVKLDYPEFITVESDDDVDQTSNNYYRVLGDSKLQSANVVSIKEPTFFEKRIKSDTLLGILQEWVKINGKDDSYLEVIKEDLNTDLLNLRCIPELRLKSLELKNFISFDTAKIDISNGLTLIEGKNEGFSSNGSGKTSLGEAIFWCLFGETTKGVTGDDVIRKYPKQQKDCVVELSIESNECDYRIQRSRKDGIKVYTRHHGVDAWHNMTEGYKIKEAQEIINKLLGFDSLIFTAATYFNQDNLFLLTKLGASEKNSTIASLLGFENYDLLLAKLNERGKALVSEKERYSGQVKVLEGQQALLNSNKSEYIIREGQFIERAGDKKKELAGVVTAREGLIAQLQAYQDQEVDTSFFDKEDSLLHSVLDGEQKKVAKVEEQIRVFNITWNGKGIAEKYEEAKSEVAILKSNIRKLNSEIGNIESTKDGTICDKCGSVVTNEHRGKYLKELVEQVKSYEDALRISEGEVSVLSAEIFNAEEESSALDRRLDELRKSISSCQTKITANAKKKQALLESKNEKDRLESDLRVQDALFGRINQELSQLKKDYLANKESIKRVAGEIESNQAAIQEGFWKVEEYDCQLTIIDFWRDGLSYKGVKSLLLDGFCNDFNALLKRYISEISNGVIAMEFSPISQTKGGESRNKLDLIIEIAGLQRSYDSLSGGEKRRIDIAVCLAFSAWIRQRFNLTSSLLGIMILDEVMSFLDASAEDCIAPILQEEAKDKAVFIISHTRELSSYCDRVITVKKENMISRII